MYLQSSLVLFHGISMYGVAPSNLQGHYLIPVLLVPLVISIFSHNTG